ncbi:hypothetical protein QTP88_015456 [Uroleucon formosanum]
MSVSVRTVYNNKIVQYPEAANNYTFLQGQRRWKRMRRSHQPNGGRIPENIHEFAEALTRPENTAYSHTLQTPPSTFFQQELVINGTNEGVIFANLDAIRFREELATVTTVGIDETFKTVLAAPADLKSFLTFQVVFKSVSFLMVYVLLRNRTEETDITLFNIVRQILHLNYNLIRFVTDFERGVMNAVQRAFPESRLGCCWFHYTQTIVQYCHRKSNGVLDLVKRSPEAARVFRMILALPHLHAVRGHPLCPRLYMYDVKQGMKNFLIGYIKHYWFFQVGPEFFSVFGEDYRTNNYLESFYSTLLVQMGHHPNVWDFLLEVVTTPILNSFSKLTYIENQFSVEFNQVRNNLMVRGGISRSQRVLATHLIAQNVQLLNEEQDLLMFLRRTGHQNDAYVQREIGPYAQP